MRLSRWHLALLAVWSVTGFAENHTLRQAEYAIKAAFLTNFIQFVKWPAARQPAAEAPWSLCILGDNPFAQIWDTSPRKAQGRIVVMRTLEHAEQAGDCHLLFVSQEEQAGLIHHLAHADGAGVLTIGDNPGFAQAGGIINFYIWQDKVRFEINAQAAIRQGLILSSRLLGLARLVEENPGP